jgi:metallo-beta-lactamase class B
MVYADSLTPVSRDGFRFSNSDSYPGVLSDFERGFALLEGLPCDVLVTPHPAASSLWDRVDQGVDGLIDTDACKQYVARAREQLRSRLESEAR